MMRQIFVCVFLCCAIPVVHAQTSTEGTNAVGRSGLVLDAAIGPYYSSADWKSSDNYTFSLGVGYFVAKKLSFGLRISTGSERLSSDVAPLMAGFFALGAAEAEGVYYLHEGETWRPFLTAAFGLTTIERWGGIGYNANGGRVGAGLQLVLSRYFGCNASIDYGYKRFFMLVNQTDPNNLFSPFIEHIIGLKLSFSFYPNIVP